MQVSQTLRGEGRRGRERDKTSREERQNRGMVCILFTAKLREAKNIVGIWPSRVECS